MPSLLEIATARRAEIETELHELDEFLERAGDLLAGGRERLRKSGGDANVLIFPRRVRRSARLAATADETGA